jgi:hypothetical protein
MIRTLIIGATLALTSRVPAMGEEFRYELCNVNDLIKELQVLIPHKSQFESDADLRSQTVTSMSSRIPQNRLRNIACELAGAQHLMAFGMTQMQE